MKRRNLVMGGGAAAAFGLAAHAFGRGASYEAAADAVWTPPSRAAAGDLAFLVHHATLAANSHNTQPWLFAGDTDAVTIRPDFSRATPVVDPDNHHLYASLGCAAENLALAATALGRSSDAPRFDTATGAVQVELGGAVAGADPLFEAIVQRQSRRCDYDSKPVAAEDLAACAAAARVEGCEVMLITERPRLEQLLELIVTANRAQIADPGFVAELRHWLRFNPAAAIRHGDGLYAPCSDNPAMPDWLADLVFPLAFGARSENAKIVRQVRSSAGFAAFVSDRDDPAHWVAAGRSVQRFALAATARGLSYAFLNQPLEVATYRPALAALLGCGDRRPDLLVRFGRSRAMPRALRRPVAEVMAAA
ncbi:Acg family FMN-binding oxidoreductase [Hoeflea olei]|uniref:Uncharacterized protein n=1 Tax=Hoeflea olei TaxID=1480615 RepID=A0A1C1YUP0_9HYPH|nr:nitroreductase family protein [Hoeflea olei]OCW57214.1 hypothetical protein AWJ14_11540 [Hoeflea olei]